MSDTAIIIALSVYGAGAACYMFFAGLDAGEFFEPDPCLVAAAFLWPITAPFSVGVAVAHWMGRK